MGNFFKKCVAIAVTMAVSATLLVPTMTWADFIASRTKQEFCSKLRNTGEVRRLLFNPDNKLAFTNWHGWFFAGICWWHSRMQRASTYLMTFRPDRPKPTRMQALLIIDKVFEMQSVVEVPGYHNLKEFSTDWAEEIAHYLSYKQAEDTAYLSFLRGLRPTQLPAWILQRQVERIYRAVEAKDKIQYLALKYPGNFVVTHAWLVIDAVKTESGYDFYVIDSNSNPQSTPDKISYKYGDTELAGTIPYLQRDDDYWNIGASIKNYCAR